MIDVLFFGRLADVIRDRKVRLPIDANWPTLFALRDHIFAEATRAGRLRSEQINMSVNQQVVREDQTLNEGDEVAFFSVFSGG